MRYPHLSVSWAEAGIHYVQGASTRGDVPCITVQAASPQVKMVMHHHAGRISLGENAHVTVT